MADELDVRASLVLDPSPGAARHARQFIADFCLAAELDEQTCETASLLTSELVANAVIHGRTRCILETHRPANLLRVSVRDDDPRLPATGLEPDLDSESGRGLLLVRKLASRWGIDPDENGKVIWFELDGPSD